MVKLHDIQTQIAILEESENDQEEIIEFGETYFEAITQAEKILSSFSTSNIHNVTIKSEERLSEIMFNPVPQMPRISLPNFAGNFEEWIPFSQTFESLVEVNKALSTIQIFSLPKVKSRG
ncbi:hypothetical protein Trydic_g23570 [Trypoxylus dichotomus]